MDPSRFDAVSRFLAQRRLSRREAMQQGIGALAAGTLATAGIAQTAAHDATPSPESDTTHFLFVQTFGAGSLAPKDGEPGLLTLTADHLAGQTVYFSDRPERIVGLVSTERFLGAGARSDSGSATPESGLGFTPANPPNAALVVASAGDASHPEAVVVVELIDPTYDPASGLATYDVKVLADETAVDLTLEQQPLSAAEAPRHFEAASLFIDDCPNGSIYCITPESFNPNNNPPDTPSQQLGLNVDIGFCYDWAGACCWPCGGPSSVAYTDTCNSTFTECQNNCTVSVQETWACDF
jgi:hypothetical protein